MLALKQKRQRRKLRSHVPQPLTLRHRRHPGKPNFSGNGTPQLKTGSMKSAVRIRSVEAGLLSPKSLKKASGRNCGPTALLGVCECLIK